MEPHCTSSPDPTKRNEPEKLKRIEWEDYQQEAARLISLSSALAEAKSKKQTIEDKLEPLIQVKAESLGRLNELEQMRQKVESRMSVMESTSFNSKVAAEDVKKEEERLSLELRSLLVAGTTLSVVRKQLEESRRLLSEERGCVHLRSLQKMLRLRQQYMVSQVSLLYPVKISAGPLEEQELESFPSSSRTGNYAGSKPTNQGSLTILDLHLTLLPFTKMSFFTDKKEVQRSATALGYVAHAVSLIASYLEVPLRYPLRLGGSHSYVNDYAPSIEPPSSDSSSSILSHANTKQVEFPLFLDGQDTTRAAYAVFLLNKEGKEMTFRVKFRAKLDKLLKCYCEKRELDYRTVQFVYEGKRVISRSTPAGLNLKEGDCNSKR